MVWVVGWCEVERFYLLFEVSDIGFGILEEDQVRLFWLFLQVGLFVFGQVFGSGLGLYIS